MGLFDKIKNIFYDEEIVEVPEKEEVKAKVNTERPKIEEIKSPKKEIIKEEEGESKSKDLPISEREIFKSATPTFKFPVLESEDDEPVTRTKTRSNILNNEKPIIKEPKRKEPVVIEERSKRPEGTFKPSPVISPVYGILDKNYKKEEIVEKKEPSYRPRTSEMNYDYVRRKAYGTLEDEIENTLTTIGLEEEIVEKPANKSIQDLISEINDNANISVGELEEKIKDKFEEIEEEIEDDSEITQEFYYKKETKRLEKEPEEIEEIEEDDEEEEVLPKRERTIEDIGDKTLEHDLFNLIDSMYEDKEEE